MIITHVGYRVDISGFIHFSKHAYLLFPIKVYNCSDMDDILEIPFMCFALTRCAAMTIEDLRSNIHLLKEDSILKEC